MAHELDMTTGRPAMAYVGNKPWHGLGENLAAGASIETWQAAAGMAWKVLRSKVRFATSCNPETLVTWDKQHVLFRSDTKAPLGVVSDRYNIVQPKEVLEFFRDLTESAGFALETAGCIFDGRRFWGLARVTADVAMADARDKVGGYVLLSTSADGTLSTTARFTTIRVVCNNTLSMALRKGVDGKAAKDVFSLPHNAEFNADDAKAHLGLSRPDEIRSGFADAMDQLRRLASTRATGPDMADATLRLFGHDPSSMTPKEIEKAAKSKAVATIGDMAVTGKGLVGADLKGGHGTAWGWLNAVTQFVDHQARTKNQDLRLDSAWFGRGDALKRKATLIAQQMADGSVTFIEQTAETPDAGASSLLDDILAATPANA